MDTFELIEALYESLKENKISVAHFRARLDELENCYKRELSALDDEYSEIIKQRLKRLKTGDTDLEARRRRVRSDLLTAEDNKKELEKLLDQNAFKHLEKLNIAVDCNPKNEELNEYYQERLEYYRDVTLPVRRSQLKVVEAKRNTLKVSCDDYRTKLTDALARFDKNELEVDRLEREIAAVRKL